MAKQLKLISPEFLEEYSSKVDMDWSVVDNTLKAKIQFSIEDFEYYIISSSLYSSKIEGNTLDANSFFRSRDKKTSPKSKEVKELPGKERGVLRKVQVGIRDSNTLKPVYMAVEPQFLEHEFSKLFDDIDELLSWELSHKEVFYFASMIHLWTAKIHPFGDGNGRAARLLEKWFLVSKLGLAAWSINSEKYYWDNRPDYYQNIALGYNYYVLYWERCIPFLLMLPKAIQ